MPSRAKTQLLLAVIVLIEVLLATAVIFAIYQIDDHTEYQFIWFAVAFLGEGIFGSLGIFATDVYEKMDDASDGLGDILFKKYKKSKDKEDEV